jgi:Flp pilus assembly pilin Flp
MRKLLQRLWNDDSGALIATEWVFVATIMVLGAITGLVAVRQAILSELTEFANAVTSLN